MREVKSRTGSLMAIFESQQDITDYTDGHNFRSEGEKFIGEKLDNWEDVMQRAQIAWEEGLDILSQSVDRLSKIDIPPIKSRKRKTVWSYDEGGEYDAERASQGLPPFRHTTREEKTGPGEVTIITDTTTPYFKDSKDILWRGAVAIALTKILEEKGYHIELWVVNGSRLFSYSDTPVTTSCCLKRCSDPLDVSTLINVVAGWFYRTVTFTLLRTLCDKHNECMSPGFGTVYTPRPADLAEITPDEKVIYSSGVYTFDGAHAVIINELNKFKKEENVDTDASS